MYKNTTLTHKTAIENSKFRTRQNKRHKEVRLVGWHVLAITCSQTGIFACLCRRIVQNCVFSPKRDYSLSKLIVPDKKWCKRVRKLLKSKILSIIEPFKGCSRLLYLRISSNDGAIRSVY